MVLPNEKELVDELIKTRKILEDRKEKVVKLDKK